MAGAQLPPGFVLDRPAAPAALPPGFVPDQPRAAPLIDDMTWFQQTYGRAPGDEEARLANEFYMEEADRTPEQLAGFMRGQQDPEGRRAFHEQAFAANRTRPQETTDTFDDPVTPLTGFGQFARTVAHNLTLGWWDELVGVFGGDTDRERRLIAAYEEVNPRAASYANLLGMGAAMALPPLAAARAANLPLRVAIASGTGAATGAAQGAGMAEGGFMERVNAAGVPALAGAAAGAGVTLGAPLVARGVGALARGASAAASGVSRLARGGAEAAPSPAPRAALPAVITPRVDVGPPRPPLIAPMPSRATPADAERFGIKLTRGQATGNLAQQADEQRILHGNRGEPAQRVLVDFMDSQNAAVRTAAERIAADLSGPLGTAIPTRDAGEFLLAGFRRYADEARTSAQAKYAASARLPAAISDGTAEQFPAYIANQLSNSDFMFDPVLHPAAFSAMREIQTLPSFAQNGVVGLQDIERIRRRLINLEGANDADNTALARVVDAFDDGIEDMINAQLFLGDPRALDLLIAARADWRRYRSLTHPDPNNDAGRIVSTMFRRDVTPEEAANWLFGASQVSPPARAVRVATMLRDTLGADSREWQAVRSAMFVNLITPRRNPDELLTPGRLSASIDSFLSGQQTMASALFTAAEREQMRTFSNTLKLIAPDPRATNPSRSSYGISRQLQDVGGRVFSAMGLQVGGIPGFIASIALDRTYRAATNFAAIRRALNPNGAQPLIQDPAAAGRALTYLLLGPAATYAPRFAAEPGPGAAAVQ